MPLPDLQTPEGVPLPREDGDWYAVEVARLRTALTMLSAAIATLGEGIDPAAITAEIAAAVGTKADLVGGFIPESQIPAVAITDTYPVASEAEMLALTAQRGDVALRSDEDKSYILRATPASTLANWAQLRTPASGVISVAGKVGVVVLTAADISDATEIGRDILKAANAGTVKGLLSLAKGDVGLGNVDNTSDTNKPISTAAQTALNLKADASALAGYYTKAEVNVLALNIRNLALSVADLRGSLYEMEDGIADAFDTADGVTLGTWVHEDSLDLVRPPRNATAGGVDAVSFGGTAVVLGGATGGNPGSNAFDGNTGTVFQSATAPASHTGNVSIGWDFGAGSEHEIRYITLRNGGTSNAVPSSVIVQYSDNGATWSGAGTFGPTATSGFVNNIAISAFGAHRHWRLLANANPTNAWQAAEITLQLGIPQNGTLTSDLDAEGAPDITPAEARLVVAFAPEIASTGLVIATHVTASVTRNGGTTWVTVPLTLFETLADGTTLYEGVATLTGAGPYQMEWRLVTTGNKDVRVTGVVLQWKA